MKRGMVEVRGGQPLRFVEDPESPLAPGTEEPEPEGCRQAARTIKAYRTALKELLAGKYAELREYAPTHLKEPCNATVICCKDGIFVRYDLEKEGETKVRSTVVAKTLAETAPAFSDYYVHLAEDQKHYDPGPHTPQITLEKRDLTSGESSPIKTIRLVILASPVLPVGGSPHPPPHKPPSLVSVTNDLHVMIKGVVVPADSTSSKAVDRSREFVARSLIKLQVGWQAIEIYPLVDPKYWNPEFAPLWAETDLLGAVARQQFADAQFAALDPNVTARKTFLHLIQQLGALLEGPEEPAHQFLKEHAELLSPTHLKAWSKLPFGGEISDFVFREPTNEYLLVELESPLRELFRQDGAPRAELTHAVDQIIDWKTYIEDNLRKVQDEMGLTGISANPNSLIVIGRSSSLSDENRRKLVTMQNQTPKLKILTYDDLIQHAKATAENLFGPLDLVGQNADIYYPPPDRLPH